MRSRILSCNIRKSEADDGDHSWPRREQVCLDVIESAAADIICFQEMRRDQFVAVNKTLFGFSYYGLVKTIHCQSPINSIFYNKELFLLESAGGYYLSETPHLVGSSSWNSASIRLANWVQLKDRQSAASLRVTNTHLDHISSEARRQQVNMVIEDIRQYPQESCHILTGDFNVNDEDEIISLLQQAGFADCHSVCDKDYSAVNTYHNFKGNEYRGTEGKIDWIMSKGPVQTVSADILMDEQNGICPSDHFFLQADIEC